MIFANYREQSTVSKVKKVYSSISQALILANTANGSGVSGWNYSNESEFIQYLKPHLRIMKDCAKDTTKECSVNEHIKLLNGVEYPAKYYSGAYRFILDDGSSLWFHLTSGDNSPIHCSSSSGGGITGVCASFFYDTNGTKKPNTLGKDIFVFYILDYSLVPDNGDCTRQGAGWGCMEYILKNGDMKYL